MLDSIQALLDTFPEGVVQVQGGLVQAVNAMARHYLPWLEPGQPLPVGILLPKSGPVGAGTFAAGPVSYKYSYSDTGDGPMILFRPAGQTALTDRQLDGALRQLRTLLGEVLAEVGPATGTPAGEVPVDTFSKSFHRLFRLMGNLEYMRQAGGEDQPIFRPVTMDLDGLCRHTVERAYPLLRESGVTLDYESPERGLLIPGSPALLQRLLLGLISNAAQAVGEGRVILTLRRQGDRALMTISDNGPLLDQRQIAALFQEGGDIPLPGQGAGLGLSIARHIVSLHRGSMLVSWGESTPCIMISLPTGPLDGRLSVQTPTSSQLDGGLDPVLTELSDVLPARLFGLEGMD